MCVSVNPTAPCLCLVNYTGTQVKMVEQKLLPFFCWRSIVKLLQATASGHLSMNETLRNGVKKSSHPLPVGQLVGKYMVYQPNRFLPLETPLLLRSVIGPSRKNGFGETGGVKHLVDSCPNRFGVRWRGGWRT